MCVYGSGALSHLYMCQSGVRRSWPCVVGGGVDSGTSVVSYPDRFRRLHFNYGEKGSGILPMREFFHPRNHKYANGYMHTLNNKCYAFPPAERWSSLAAACAGRKNVPERKKRSLLFGLSCPSKPPFPLATSCRHQSC